jgi:MerR family transcriptional regulator, repressor of the yfmOP operon
MTGSAGELSIGEAAARVGVSSRTLRYYEELGLLTPSGRTPGGARRYTDDDIATLEHIRELQELMGFNRDEILAVMRIEDRLAKLRAEWQAGRPPERRAEMIEEALRHNADLRARVEAKIARLGAFLDSLDERRERYRRAQREMDALVPSSK